MIKVICFAEMYPSSVNAYMGSFIHSQNRALMGKGIEIKVISPVPWIPFPFSLKEQWSKLNRIPRKEVLDGIEVYHPRRPILPKRLAFHLNGFLYYKCIYQFVIELLHRFDFDLIHAHMALPDGFAGALLTKEIQRPLIITIHGKDTANAQWSTAHRNPRCKAAIFKALMSSSKIVAVSDYVKRSTMEVYPSLDSRKIVVIHGGVDLTKSQLREKKQSDTMTILSVGPLIPLKGHRYTIDAMKEVVKAFPNCRLMIIGEGEEKKKLMRQVAGNELQNFVSILNILPHEQLLKLMSICDIFVLPSWAEGLGIVYLEAMALGLPVIGCKGQGIEDIVSHGETGFLVEPKNSRQLTSLLLELLRDEGVRRKIGEAGQEVVLKNYRWGNNAAKHVQLYESLIRKQNT
jgi:glycosyltransferase involved in cell wall biosynthesis